MDCYVGAATGALKSVLLKDNSFFNVNRVKDLDPKKDEITAMIWADEDQTELLTAQLNRQLKILDCAESTQSTMFTIEGGDGTVKGIHLAPNERIVTCVESGAVKIWSKKGKEQGDWNVGEGITSMQGCNKKSLIATGGRKNLVKTWDLETGKQVWSAKNVPLDMLQLEVPIMITDLRFVDDGNQIIEATKLHEMRLYDPRAQRRPVKKIPFMESPITSVSTCYRPNHIVAANAIGEIGLFDIRSKVHPLYKYKGQTGSIRSLDGHPTAPYVASCGIDRFVRVHDMETRKLIHKIYCKTRMNKILIRKDLSILKKMKKEEEDWEQLEDLDNSDDESEDENASSTTDDEVWEELDNGKKTSRKRKDSEEETVPEPAKKLKKAPPRKRKDSESMDEISEEPMKRSKKEKKQPEIKEEPLSEEDDEDEPVPAKRRKIQKKKKA